VIDDSVLAIRAFFGPRAASRDSRFPDDGRRYVVPSATPAAFVMSFICRVSYEWSGSSATVACTIRSRRAR
jgi:hypothetical protein